MLLQGCSVVCECLECFVQIWGALQDWGTLSLALLLLLSPQISAKFFGKFQPLSRAENGDIWS